LVWTFSEYNVWTDALNIPTLMYLSGSF
jgi:hypothetical protein